MAYGEIVEKGERDTVLRTEVRPALHSFVGRGGGF